VGISSQKFIARNRPPRVQIEYELEFGGAKQLVSLPFVVGILADLSGSSKRLSQSLNERQMRFVDIDNFDQHLRDLAPRVAFTVPNTFDGRAELLIDITFKSMDDFSPSAIARKVPGLDRLLEQRTQLENLVFYMDGKRGAESLVGQVLNDASLLEEIASKKLRTSSDGTEDNIKEEKGLEHETLEQSPDALSELLIKEFKPKSDRAFIQLESAFQALAKQALSYSSSYGIGPETTINEIIRQIDLKLSRQINHILHHPEFQLLEGAWRGLNYLIENSETDEILKVRIMSISKKELGKTIKQYKGSAWDQSPLFKKIYDDEFGLLGGQPYGCLIGDYEFDNSPQDVEILRGMARIAAAAHAPFITAASPSVMKINSWQEITNSPDLTKIFMTPEYTAWRSLRESEDSRYLALTMPRFLARRPYGNFTDPVEEFDFQEEIQGWDSKYFTWCNSAYAMGVNITRAFKLYGWLSRIRGMESGGMLGDFPTYSFPADDGSIDTRSPTEVSISDRREAELAKSGFMPLVHVKNTDSVVFIGAQSFHKPEEYDDPDATTAATLAARLPYLLSSCRFAHYLKCIVRDHIGNIGTFSTREDMQKWLNDWILQYVGYDPANLSEESKARKPLASAEVVLDDIEGDPGNYASKFYLRPYYQLEGLTISFRLFSKLPSGL
jgi:type VI secretion system protein ImpC